MGSTGRGLYKNSKTGNVNTETFGISGATNFKGKLPADSGLEAVGSNKITLKLDSISRMDIFFQFKLSKDGSSMTITGYDPNLPSKAKVKVSANNPSLDNVIASGKGSEKNNALKLKDMMSKSVKVDESQLGAIANKLKSGKGAK